MIDPRDDLAFRRERNAANKCAVLTQRAMADAFSRRATEIVDLIDDDKPSLVSVVARPYAHTSEGGEG